MKKITWWLLSTATVLVLLFSYRTSTDSVAAISTPPSISTPTTQRVAADPSTATATTTVTAGADGTGTPTADSTTDPTAAATTETPATTEAAATGGTFTGVAAATRYGPVQVQITVQDGKITTATALEYPYHDHRDQEINDYAIPLLNQETVDGQSANISMVWGATYTSDGYLQSLQSAIDQAHLT